MVLGKLLRWFGGSPTPRSLPDELWQEAIAGLPFLQRLDATEMIRLRQLTGDFLAQKEFTSAGGLELTDAMRVSIAVQGCLPILNLGLACYRNWIGVVVYPDEFVIPRTIEDEFGVVHEYDDVASGEAWDGGPLLVSWRDAQMAGDGYNVVIHEFAHKLDMLNGEANGIPPLPGGVSRETWERILYDTYDDFCARLDSFEDAGGDPEDVDERFFAATGFDAYAAESPGEFFAVMSETFFEQPDHLRRAYPDLYAQFCLFYRQDPAASRGQPATGADG